MKKTGHLFQHSPIWLKVVFLIIVSCVFESLFVLADPTDPSDPNNWTTNSSSGFAGTNCACCGYPTNATFKWVLFEAPRFSIRNPISLSPQGVLYMPTYPGLGASDSLYGIQVNGVNTNNPDYPSFAPFLTYESTVPSGTKSPAVIAPDGSICLNSYTSLGGVADNYIVDFDPSLGVKWTLDLQQVAGGETSPVIADDGTIYVASRTIFVALTNAPGMQTTLMVTNHDWGNGGNFPLVTNTYGLTNVGIKWIFSYPDAYISNTNLLVYPIPNGAGFYDSRPTIGPAGTVFVNTLHGQLLALNPTNGVLEWATPKLRNEDIPLKGEASPSGSSVSTAPIIGADGTIYFGADTAFYSVNPQASTTNSLMGFKAYYTNFNELFILNPIIGSDGTIYAEAVGNGPFNLYYYDVFDNDYIGPTNICTNALFAFDSQLNPKWVTYLSTNAADAFATAQGGVFPDKSGSLALGSDGELYMADWDGMFYSFCSSTGTTNYSFNTINVVPSGETAVRLHSPLIGPDGVVYFDGISFTTDRSYIFAFAGSPIACAPWPEDQKNARRSAFVTSPLTAGHLSAPIMQTNGFQFTVAAPTNTIECLCASTNLITWTNIGQINLASSQTNFLDTNATNFDRRFYMAKPQ